MAKCNESSLLQMGTFEYTVLHYITHMNQLTCSARGSGNKVSLYFAIFCMQEPMIKPQRCVWLECTYMHPFATTSNVMKGVFKEYAHCKQYGQLKYDSVVKETKLGFILKH